MKLQGKIVGLDLDFFLHKPKITIQLTNQQDILTDKFNKLQQEELLDIELEKHREQRGLQANKYFHSLVNQLARHFTITDDEMKIKMNTSYGTLARGEDGQVLGAKVPKGTDLTSFYPYAKWYKEDDGCDCYLFYKRTSELNTLEFSQLLNGVIQEAKDVGIKTLDELEIERMLEEYAKRFK